MFVYSVDIIMLKPRGYSIYTNVEITKCIATSQVLQQPYRAQRNSMFFMREQDTTRKLPGINTSD